LLPTIPITAVTIPVPIAITISAFSPIPTIIAVSILRLSGCRRNHPDAEDQYEGEGRSPDQALGSIYSHIKSPLIPLLIISIPNTPIHMIANLPKRWPDPVQYFFRRN
jgi:hypothetical protein